MTKEQQYRTVIHASRKEARYKYIRHEGRRAEMVDAMLPTFEDRFRICNGLNQALWQELVPLEIQGRVFAARRLLAQASIPISMAIVGSLVDNVFKPISASKDFLYTTAANIGLTGPGTEISLLLIISGVLGLIL